MKKQNGYSRKVLIVLAIFYTAVLSLNYMLGTVKTPAGYVFLGTVHHPNDYFYYLSMFTQGKTHWIYALDLFTAEKVQPTLVGFTNVLAGHMLSIVNISPIPAYQLTVTLYTFVFFLLIIFLLEAVFPKEKETQCVAFILFGIANVVPGTGSFFANVTEPMTRFTRVPHHMLGLICILLPMLIVSKCQERSCSRFTKYILAIVTIGASILLANINPIQWALVSCTLFTTVIWKRGKLVPVLFLFSGLPMIIYLLRLFNTLPFLQSAVWEYSVQIRLSLINFIESFGPVFIFAVLGLPLFCRRLTLVRILIVVYTIVSIVLFLSPISEYAHITNFRFISALTIFGESVLAAYFITHIPITNNTVRRIVTWIIVAAFFVLLIPQFIDQFQRHAYLDVSDSYVYLSGNAYSAYMETQRLTNNDDIILTTWPFDVSFPAITGRRGFMGHPFFTIDSKKKILEASLFFDAQIDDAAMHKFLRDNHITYVLGFTSVIRIMKPFLQAVYQNPLLTLYKVLPY